ncbi:Uma2 family endonuclease [Cryomorpha ignava]|uniref:Uma2 family endonuclease n=1 Tax=Cryomorpha ignava TaxID=101383 RepID=A0A7K3WMQ5_9FLAO|nr:Uma2 family endonuclease [Cryomorpha ignava]NEN22764.1 Uma2 family endonuclease [Cryomorpha ignava]
MGLSLADVYLIHPGEDWKETRNILQPDLFIVCDPSKIHDRGCFGAPDLVVEVRSPSTAAKDVGIKRDLYEEYGVKELWIVHPVEGTITEHILENEKYRILQLYAKGQIVQSLTFPDLRVDLEEVFNEDQLH